MIAKSYVLVLLLPLVLYHLGIRKWLSAAATIACMAGLIVTTVYLESPAIHVKKITPVEQNQREVVALAPVQAGDPVPPPVTSAPQAFEKVVGVLHGRLFRIQGELIDAWASSVPNEMPYLKGCGYRPLATLIGCDYVYMPNVVYNKLYPDLVQKYKIKGAANTTNFMNDYVNFGYWGIVLSAFATCLVLLLLESVYARSLLMIALNFSAILMLMETTLSLMLHSGGALLMALLYIVFRSRFEGDERSSVWDRA